MKTKTKILLVSALMLFGLGLANLLNIFLNFRETSIANAIEKSKMAANIVKDGLTAHMVNGMMPQREYFLKQISTNDEIKSLWLVRGKNVINQYGEGFMDETPRDSIDKDVLLSGKLQKQLTENINQMILRVTIPYTATNQAGTINCLSCHNVKKGDTLGVISMEFDISKIRTNGAVTLFKIMAMNLLFVIMILFLINYYVAPFTKLFTNLQTGIRKAYQGDFTHNFSTTLGGDAGKIIRQMNILFSKIQDSFGDVRHSLAAFAPKNGKKADNPLDEANQIIHELSDIYKFKKTIELDTSKSVVYTRIVNIFKTKYNLKHFALYEINDKKRTRELIHIDDGEKSICYAHVDENSLECRAYRTETDVISTEFTNLCQGCERKDVHHSCFFYNINDEYSIVVSITTKDKDELKNINKEIPHLRNYLEAAKPVIESKLLMEKLRQTSLKDGMTGLYNRRFLEEFIEKFMNQANRNKETYHVMMLDVDWFKQVNDTYGHDVGDMVIVEIGKLLQKHIRTSDMAIRYGGEEFIIMLQNSTDDGAMMVAKNIHSGFAATEFKVGAGESMFKTMSIGIAKFPTDGDTIWKCIKYADTALYVAKDTGRNKIVEFKQDMFENNEI